MKTTMAMMVVRADSGEEEVEEEVPTSPAPLLRPVAPSDQRSSHLPVLRQNERPLRWDPNSKPRPPMTLTHSGL